jgi:hypothetical protein
MAQRYNCSSAERRGAGVVEKLMPEATSHSAIDSYACAVTQNPAGHNHHHHHVTH